MPSSHPDDRPICSKGTTPASNNPQEGNSSGGRTRWLTILSWLPSAVVAMLLILFVWIKPQAVHNSPLLLTVLNTLFLSIISFLVAILAGQTYLAGHGRFPVMLGCGAISLALGALLAGLPPGESNPNYTATVYNSSALLASICHMAGAVWFLIGSRQKNRPRGLLMLVLYPAVVVLICLITMLARNNLLPTFFINGIGPTVWNAALLRSAAVLFTLTAIFLSLKDRNRSAFVRWYTISLTLIAIGLVGVSLQKYFGDPINWIGRIGQYLGGIYMLIAITATIRQSGGWEIPLERALYQAEQARVESEERLAFALETVQTGAWDLDLVDHTAFRSLVHDRIFGYKTLLPEWTYDMFLEHVLPEDRPMVDEKYRTATETQTDWSFECRIRRTDGEIRWIWAAGRHQPDAGGGIRRLAGIVQDITERKRAEEALRRANDELENRVSERTEELAQRASQLRALAGELTLSEQRERRRMARLLHDHLQQLLVGAKFHTAILSRAGDDLVRQGAKEVEDLLDESIAASRSLTAELSPPILHEAGLSAGLKWAARWMADKHGLFVELSIEDENFTLSEDVRILLFESVRELLFNAAKHSRARSATVNVRRLNGSLQIVVSDQGAGFDLKSLPQAGEKGSGFGLFSIRERLDLIGGRLEIDSSPGNGSRFLLTVPLGQTSIQPEPVTAGRQPAVINRRIQTVSPIQSAMIRMMLADDHPVMRQGLGELLRREPDFQIVGEAADGQEAVELA
jgi:PAS domain S-box-containing protein